jgi:hypothetical protein
MHALFKQGVSMLDSIISQRCENLDRALTIENSEVDKDGKLTGRPGTATTSNFLKLKGSLPETTGFAPVRARSTTPLNPEAPVMPAEEDQNSGAVEKKAVD